MTKHAHQEAIPGIQVWAEPRLPFESDANAEFDVYAMREELRVRNATDEEIAAFEQEFLPEATA